MGRRRKGASALVLLVTFCCMGWVATAAGSGRPPSARAAGENASVEASIRGCANRNRQAQGLRSLEHDGALDRAARLQAREMLSKGYFDHVDPEGNGPADRVRRYAKRRYVIVGENIAAGFESAGAACRGWMKSRGHRENILRTSFTRIGTGFAEGSKHYGRYYVQVFADVK